ncbi:MAG: PQQ-dependent sugar dehydrogenase [Deltaproteobacteria bacterium]|nr:PQQ-dependent sugar dehydrogenase [Myxococcales bacterium]MDP3217362.1 PQQ-dependent sugar dehydrogenase [Deltaproteobacteria bacterium]
MRPSALLLPGIVLLGCTGASPTQGTSADSGSPVADAPVVADPCRGTAEAAWTSDPSVCLVRFATGISRARGLAIAPNGDVFVNAAGSVTVLFDADGDGVSGDGERATFATAPGLNHGIAFSPDNRYLYASSDTTVYRWAYTAGARSAGERETVVTAMPAGANHPVRPLVFDAAGDLYVAVGSAGNVDTSATLTATRSMIRKFSVATVPVAYAAGEVFASGLRNEVGLAFDSAGRMWGVENGRDQLTDSRFGGDIHENNPGEELNVLNGPGSRFFGYPYCWTEGTLPSGAGKGTQHADLSVPAAMRREEAFCQDAAMVRPPAFSMPAHWAPLGLTEYTGSVLPAAWRGNLFITAHGSWNRNMATGRLIARAQVGADGRVTAVEPVVGQSDGAGGLRQGSWGVRPVDIRQGVDGALYFTDDQGGRVFRIGARRP